MASWSSLFCAFPVRVVGRGEFSATVSLFFSLPSLFFVFVAGSACDGEHDEGVVVLDSAPTRLGHVEVDVRLSRVGIAEGSDSGSVENQIRLSEVSEGDESFSGGDVVDVLGLDDGISEERWRRSGGCGRLPCG